MQPGAEPCVVLPIPCCQWYRMSLLTRPRLQFAAASMTIQLLWGAAAAAQDARIDEPATVAADLHGVTKQVSQGQIDDIVSDTLERRRG